MKECLSEIEAAAEERALLVLIVDDQRSARRVLTSMLSRVAGVQCLEAASLDEARASLAAEPDVVLVDIRLNDDVRDESGLTLIEEIRASSSATPIVVSAVGEMAHIRAAMRLGAYDFLLKEELNDAVVIPMLEKLRDRRRLETEVLALRARAAVDAANSELVGTSRAMTTLRALIRRVSLSTRPVLITGPTGCGKELVARAIHRGGPHPQAQLLDVNCSGIPETLVESQLFGHERGAFTGADRRHTGFFSAVQDGTLFLDEVGELPLSSQAKLLRVIESCRFRPLGANTDLPFCGRLVTATHRDLRALVAEGKFREDLLFRLNVLTIQVPSLERRPDDIPALVSHFLAGHERRLRFTAEAMALLVRAEWPGNVRQLRNWIDRLAVFAEDELITPDTIEMVANLDAPPLPAQPLRHIARSILRLSEPNKLAALDFALATEALLVADGNKSAAARLLGIDRKALERRLSRDSEQAP